jgi:hypothetical protein
MRIMKSNWTRKNRLNDKTLIKRNLEDSEERKLKSDEVYIGFIAVACQ